MQVYWHNFRPISFNFFIPSIPIAISIDSFHIISHVSLLFIDCTLYPLKSISECSLLTTKKFLAMCNQAARQAPSFSAPSTNIPPFPVTTDIRRATLRFAAAQCYATLISLSLSLSLTTHFDVSSSYDQPPTTPPSHPAHATILCSRSHSAASILCPSTFHSCATSAGKKSSFGKFRECHQSDNCILYKTIVGNCRKKKLK